MARANSSVRNTLALLAALWMAPTSVAGESVMPHSSPEERVQLAATMRELGFNCPEIKEWTYEGEGPIGEHGKISCGEIGKPGINPQWVFRITLRPNGTGFFSPWK